jgi:hypothetical protein
MNKEDIKKLINNEVAGYKISIISPTHKKAPENLSDSLNVKNLSRDARNMLTEKLGKKEAQPILDNMDAAIESIDWQKTWHGVAIYADTDTFHVYDLPTSPEPNVFVSENYATRELVKSFNRSNWLYHVLVLSENPTRLFEGQRHRLEEINGAFPITHNGPGGSEGLPTGFGQRTSSIRDEYHKQFFRVVANKYKEVVGTEKTPLIVLGVDRYISFWNEVAPQYAPDLVMHGNYDRLSAKELSDKIRENVYQFFMSRHSQLIEKLAEAQSANKLVSGISEVYVAAEEGRIGTLIVPEHKTVSAYVNSKQASLFNDIPDARFIPDLIDDIVEQVIMMGGEVHFVEDNLLEPYHNIAAITRY